MVCRGVFYYRVFSELAKINKQYLFASYMISLEVLRSGRFFGYAVFDLVVSFASFGLLALLLSRLFLKIRISVPKWNWMYLVLPIGILIHLVFGRMTPMTI